MTVTATKLVACGVMFNLLDAFVAHCLNRNNMIDPEKGKRAVGLPDPKGRQDLFDVLHARRPGTCSPTLC